MGYFDKDQEETYAWLLKDYLIVIIAVAGIMLFTSIMAPVQEQNVNVRIKVRKNKGKPPTYKILRSKRSKNKLKRQTHNPTNLREALKKKKT